MKIQLKVDNLCKVRPSNNNCVYCLLSSKHHYENFNSKNSFNPLSTLKKIFLFLQIKNLRKLHKKLHNLTKVTYLWIKWQSQDLDTVLTSKPVSSPQNHTIKLSAIIYVNDSQISTGKWTLVFVVVVYEEIRQTLCIITICLLYTTFIRLFSSIL